LADLGGDGDGDGALVDAVGDLLPGDVEPDLDRRLLGLEEDLRRVGDLQRQVLQVHALDREYGGLRLLGHGWVLRWSGEVRGPGANAVRKAAARARPRGRARTGRRSRRRGARR